MKGQDDVNVVHFATGHSLNAIKYSKYVDSNKHTPWHAKCTTTHNFYKDWFTAFCIFFSKSSSIYAELSWFNCGRMLSFQNEALLMPGSNMLKACC